MIIDYFKNYGMKFPDVIIKIMEYFDISNNVPDTISEKSVFKFCQYYMQDGKWLYEPQIISLICKRLHALNYLTRQNQRDDTGIRDNYLFVQQKPGILGNKEKWQYFFNSNVYGFTYIYELFKEIVVPLVWKKESGDYSVGTGFKYENGIVTAKHCIEDVNNLSIKGYKAEELEGKKIYISSNDGVDIAFIETGKTDHPHFFNEDGQVMQEVIVMGYPKIPAFTDFLTVEKATISSKATVRLTPTRGEIAAFGYEYLSGVEAMLITARIRGGNSGGPVISQHGIIVGVACHIPDTGKDNGDYDDLGYGVAVPMKCVTEIIERKERTLPVKQGFFRDFEG